MASETTNPTWSVKAEETLLNRSSTQLWLPTSMRIMVLGGIAQLYNFYYRAQGAYKDPEGRIDSYISNSKTETKKVAIVTGANTGIGFETAKALGKAGYKVILACRNQSKAENAISKILTEHPSANLKFMELDLSSFNSVRSFATEFNDNEPHLDLLVNNAGIMILPEFEETEDGNEKQYQVNYLSTFLLTRLLINKLKASNQSKIITLSSLAHYSAGECDFSSVNDKNAYSPEGNYCYSKAALVMMTHSLQKKLMNHNIEVYAVHPGIVQTELYRYQGWISMLTNVGGRFIMKSPLEGALTVIRLSLIPRNDIQHEDNQPIYYTDDMAMEPLVWTKDEAKQEALWDETSNLLKLSTSLDN